MSEFGHDDHDEFGGFDLGTALGSIASSAAQSAGVDPGIISAAQTVMSTPIAKQGFTAGLNAAVGAVAKGVGDAPAAVHVDPSVQAAKAALPPDAHAGFDAGVALAAAHAAGAAVPGLTPAAQAAHLIAAGAPASPLAPASVPWWKVAAGGALSGAGALALSATIPIAAVATAIGAGVTYVVTRGKPMSAHLWPTEARTTMSNDEIKR
jgi:hypothetical protein